MAHLALDVVAVLVVLCAFGLAPAVLLCPAQWRRWWPLLMPILGLAVLTVIEQWLGTLFTVGGSVIPAFVVALAVGVVCIVRMGVARPSAWAVVALLAVVPAGLLAYRPSLRLHHPRPSGILNEDSIYYLSVDSW